MKKAQYAPSSGYDVSYINNSKFRHIPWFITYWKIMRDIIIESYVSEAGWQANVTSLFINGFRYRRF